ncbi:hypothetical protein H4CHR_04901 [Variovorax sp. PBS-H4]|uniref:SGNH/GDSL hydrolase family protein n=1 Tax=Variovorax sp. PBS-H4 TaxID=434008 RepID=UPI001318A257|nr:SGNH/GDSL hydrolase family protein [Variovorax sp. PBS-H4]VTU39996.1 hypothetical protein H4CHR_04901 [Variovorax sp. PBS-H4]
MKRSARIAAGGLALAMAAGALVMALWSDGMPHDTPVRSAPASDAIPFAVLGDSNSHSYQDKAWFPPDSTERGGAFRARTFQWTEVLARLRGHQIDPGPWMRWGRPGVVALAREWMGLPGGRAPRKEDYLYNFANSGAACKNLMQGRFRQVPRLVALMDQEPERWRRGVVVIRIGLNSWAGLLDLQASDPDAPELRKVTAFCAGEIRAAVRRIQASHPATRILLVGIGNEADDPANSDRWQSAKESRNIRSALEAFNAAIRQLAQGDERLAYFDDVAWFETHWGSRNAEGKPAYKTVQIGSALRVTNSVGDDPHNSVLADLHSGLVWNALWAQALVKRLRDAFDLPIAPIEDEELRRFLEPLTAAAPARAPGS